MIHNLLAQRKELLCNLSSFFWRIGGGGAGLWISNLYFEPDSWLYFLLPTIGVLAGETVHILICKRKGLSDDLLLEGFTAAGAGVGWWIAYHYFDYDSFLGVLPIFIGPFLGEKVLAMVRKISARLKRPPKSPNPFLQ